jgi:hypothetical protein
MIKKIITDREEILGISESKFKTDNGISDMVKVISANNKYLDKKRIENILIAAKVYGLIDGIDFDNWIYDVKLDGE